jgi:hypothetical protein
MSNRDLWIVFLCLGTILMLRVAQGCSDTFTEMMSEVSDE